MSQSINSLKEIPFDSLKQLRDFYKNNWPENLVTFNFIDCLIQNPEKSEFIKICNADGTVEKDATFIGFMHDKELFISTLEPSLEKLRPILKSLDFTAPRYFICAKNIYRKCLLEFFSSEKIEILADYVTNLIRLEKEDALKLDIQIPKGFQLKSLSHREVYKVDSEWHFRDSWSKNFLEFNIKHNPSVGLFNENGELVSWCLSHHFRMLLALQTDTNHLRKGYAEIVTKALSKKIAEELNCDITAVVVLDNKKSSSLFFKIGFKVMDKYSWVEVKKKSVENEI